MSAAQPLHAPRGLKVTGLVKRFGGFTVTDGLDLDVQPGEIHAVIGPNGAGKTTLINQLCGEMSSDGGCIAFDGADVRHLPVDRRARLGIARSYQITSVFQEFSALQNVMLAVQGASGRSMAFWKPVWKDQELVRPARDLLARVGLADRAERRVSALAHGARRQLEIAMTLALRPRVMLLDEPMAGMSHHESADMVRLLQTLRGSCAIVLVEHDMDAVFALADRITVIVRGRHIATGTADEIRDNQEVRAAYLGDATAEAV
ncbi:ATP-binding cassette domain-containing protein [Variovorax sp. RKNM96]|uniref:ABC transporter ATP-binding protein n=1 Tax=Variovorax sp. RKNM96 TaxID=2681552 RepID=UPI001980C8FE|nr:ABC transporter ATP-binding protein [Variovorax sp. RKNM96]QSI33262.1 ATP-binding cassette domain-containing protein [Variovorax sp. RKNM96]